MKILATLILFIFTITVYAQDTLTISAERPGNGYNATVLPSENFQIEYGAGSYSNKFTSSLQLRGGIEKNLEIKLGLASYDHKVVAMNVGLKYAICNQVAGLVTLDAIVDDTIAPYIFTLRAIGQKGIGNFSVCTNVGAGYSNNAFFIGVLGVSYNNDILVPYLEYSLYGNTSTYCIGVSRTLGKNVALDFGIYANDYTAISRFEFGIAWNCK